MLVAILFYSVLNNFLLLFLLFRKKKLASRKPPDEALKQVFHDLAVQGFGIVRIDAESIFLRGTR